MTDVFRKTYKQLEQKTKDDIFMIKTKAEELMAEFDAISVNQSIDPRSMALAKTNLEQSVMWAIKAIT